MNTHDAIEKVKHLKDYIMVFENIHQVTLMDDSDKEAIDTVVAELEKPTYTVEDMKSAWESGCLVGCEQENDIIYNREKSNYLTFERWIEGREK